MPFWKFWKNSQADLMQSLKEDLHQHDSAQRDLQLKGEEEARRQANLLSYEKACANNDIGVTQHQLHFLFDKRVRGLKKSDIPFQVDGLWFGAENWKVLDPSLSDAHMQFYVNTVGFFLYLPCKRCGELRAYFSLGQWSESSLRSSGQWGVRPLENVDRKRVRLELAQYIERASTGEAQKQTYTTLPPCRYCYAP